MRSAKGINKLGVKPGYVKGGSSKGKNANGSGTIGGGSKDGGVSLDRETRIAHKSGRFTSDLPPSHTNSHSKGQRGSAQGLKSGRAY